MEMEARQKKHLENIETVRVVKWKTHRLERLAPRGFRVQISARTPGPFVQWEDIALSTRKQEFDSPKGRQFNRVSLSLVEHLPRAQEAAGSKPATLTIIAFVVQW